MKVQNGEQPRRLKPLQSSDEARNPKGIAASSSALAFTPEAAARSDARGSNKLIALTASAAIRSSQNGAASHQFISIEKSIANRISRIADTSTPIRSNQR